MDQPALPSRPSTVDWSPRRGTAMAMNVAGTAMAVAGIIGYALLYSIRRNAAASVAIDLWGLLLMVVAVVVTTVVHEGIHGVVIAALGARPRFGAQLVAKVMPVLYCTAPGARFTKTQFIAVALAPLVLLGGLLAVLVAFMPGGGWLVLPAGIHLGGCVGDLWMSVIAVRQPPATMIEDLKSGMRLHRPQPG